jgi:hypothetical protein
LHKRLGNFTQSEQDLTKAKMLAQQELEHKTQH